jgi:hypothetical protein
MAQTAQSGPTPHFVTGRALLYEYPGTHDFFPLHFILLVVMSNVPHLRNEEDLRKGAKKLLVAGVEAQCCSGRGLTVHH